MRVFPHHLLLFAMVIYRKFGALVAFNFEPPVVATTVEIAQEGGVVRDDEHRVQTEPAEVSVAVDLVKTVSIRHLVHPHSVTRWEKRDDGVLRKDAILELEIKSPVPAHLHM
jgi:hypothetical protein